MACFIVPAAEAIVTTVATKISENHQVEEINVESEVKAETKNTHSKPLFIKQLKWLSGMLWGGAVLLLLEHVWHGEVVPYFPFLTAASNPADKAAMLHEMGTAGIGMAALITVVWACMVAVTTAMAKKDTASERQ